MAMKTIDSLLTQKHLLPTKYVIKTIIPHITKSLSFCYFQPYLTGLHCANERRYFHSNT